LASPAANDNNWNRHYGNNDGTTPTTDTATIPTEARSQLAETIPLAQLLNLQESTHGGTDAPRIASRTTAGVRSDQHKNQARPLKNLKPGNVLIFEEVLGPKTGVEPTPILRIAMPSF